MKTKTDNRVLWWAAFAFALLISAWTALFTIAAHHRVAETPLVTSPPR